MTNEELEFSISQYVDGSLPPTEASALEERLATDTEARELLSQYRKLDALLVGARAATAPIEVRWDRLASHISKAIDEESAEPESYPMPWVRRWTARIAIAACVVMAVGWGVRVYLSRPGAVDVGGGALAKVVVDVTGPQIESSKSTAVSEVAIGPAESDDQTSIVGRYADGVVLRPSRVLIASDLGSFDSDAMPY